MATYYYAVENEQLGPVDQDFIRNLFEEMKINGDTLIWTETLENWTMLKDTNLGIEIMIPSQPLPSPPSPAIPIPVAPDVKPLKKQEVTSSSVKSIVNTPSSATKSVDRSITEAALTIETTPTTSKHVVKSKPLPHAPVVLIDDGVEDEHEGSLPVDASEVWIEDDNTIWTKAKIISYHKKVYKVQNILTGKVFRILDTEDSGSSSIFKVDSKVAADITSLLFIHEPAILHNLSERFKEKQPYTFMASVLIAVNPLRRLPQPDMSSYVQTSSKGDTAPPHPNALAETAFQQLNFARTNQSVVISGESGAGKTETAKIILQYLVQRSQGGESMAGLDARLLQSSPILESFGNAKTSKNNNSSRFGKFLKLLYSKSSKKASAPLSLVGATVETYLLEKSRVVRQSTGERNYHVFYQLLSGIQSLGAKIPPKIRSIIGQHNLKTRPEQFSLLNQSGCLTIDGVKEDAQFQEILNALSTVGFADSSIEEILMLLYGILLLGNISFIEEDSAEGSVSAIQDSAALGHLSTMVGINVDTLRSLLCERRVFTRGEFFTKRLSVINAVYTRDAVTKSLYESLFQYIVDGINIKLTSLDSTTLDVASLDFIGVLDIFGFENFTENQFEQLLINYANEAIQNTFNKQVFDAELRLYQSENLDFVVSSIPDNTGCVDLIAEKTGSVLFLLDSICRDPKPSDERLCDELHKSFNNKNKFFLPVHPKDRYNTFMIRHYAGPVKYTVTVSSIDKSAPTGDDVAIGGNTWIAKNNDSFPNDLSSACQSSSLQLMTVLSIANSTVSERSVSPMPSGKSAAQKRPSTIAKPTISSRFTKSMHELNGLLQSTSCQFVRCIKPNRQMIPDVYENLYVVEQLRSLGVLQTCEVLKAGLPTRVKYQELKQSLGSVIQPVEHLFKDLPESIMMACLLRAYGISSDIYKLGRTMVFFKAGQLALLNSILNGEKKNDPGLARRIEEAVHEVEEAMNAIRFLTEEAENLEKEVKSADHLYGTQVQKVKSFLTSSAVRPPEVVTESMSLLAKLTEEVKVKIAELSGTVESTSAAIKTADSALSLSNKKVNAKKIVDDVDRAVKAFNTDLLGNTVKTEYPRLLQKFSFLQQGSGVKSLQDNLKAWEDRVDEMKSLFEKASSLVILANDGVRKCQLEYTQAKAEEFKMVKIKLTEIIQGLKLSIDSSNAKLSAGGGGGDNYGEIKTLASKIIDAIKLSLADIQRYEGLLDKIADDIEAAEEIAKTKAISDAKAAVAAKKAAMSKNSSSGEEDPEIVALRNELQEVQAEISRLKALAISKGLISNPSTQSASPSVPSVPSKPPPPKGEPPKRRASVMGTGDESASIAAVAASPAAPEISTPTAKSPTGAVKARRASVTTGNVSSEAKVAVSKLASTGVAAATDDSPLPEGWKEAIDKTSNRKYYVNKITKERTWKRPQAAAQPVQAVVEDATNPEAVAIAPVSRFSRRLTGKEAGALSEQLGQLALGNPSKTSGKVQALPSTREAAISRLRDDIDAVQRLPSVTGNYTMKQLAILGSAKKTGFLQKQSKLLGRWKKRYFVLDGPSLEYYDNESEASDKSKAKVFHLQATSCTSYTSKDSCFLVKLIEEDGKTAPGPDDWYLLAESEDDMEEWMSAINAHIFVKYKVARSITTDFTEEGEIGTSFWFIPSSSSGINRLPVPIRTLPFIDAPRTVEGVHPGEVIQIVQVITRDDNRFLRMAEDRGWVYEKHSKSKYSLLQPASGSYVEESSVVRLDRATKVYSGPSLECVDLEDILMAGTDVEISAKWTSSDGLTFGRLKASGGWIQVRI